MKYKIIPIFLLLTFSIFSVQAKLYKWVDEQGQTHFGDSIPAQYLLKKHQELNQHGDVIKHFPAAETAAQKAEKRRLQAKQKKIAQQKRKAQQRDRVLLDTYTTERDLTLARDARLDAIDSQINLAKSIIKDSSNKIKALNTQIATIKASARKVPKYIFDQLKNEKQQVKIHSRVAANDQKRRDEISLQFNGYIKRFKVLKAQQRIEHARFMKERDL